MIWTSTLIIFILFLSDKTFTALTIPAVITGRINMLFQALPNFLHALNMGWVGGTDKVGIFYIEFLKKILKFGRVLVNIFLNIYLLFPSLFFNFITVFVSPSLKAHIFTLHGLIASIDISKQIILSMPNMRSAVNIRDCRRNINFLRHEIL